MFSSGAGFLLSVIFLQSGGGVAAAASLAGS